MLNGTEKDLDKDISALVSIADRLTKKEIPHGENEKNHETPTKLREDSAKIFENIKEALDNAPAQKDGYIFVPSIMEAEGK